MLKSPKSIPILHSCNLPQKRQTNLLILEYCDLAITQINHLRFSFTNFFRLHVSTFLTFFLFTFAFLSAFGGFTTSYGQVKIKEKVEIKPLITKGSSIIRNNILTEPHSIRLEYSWIPSYQGTKPRFGYRIRTNTPFCSDNRSPEYEFDGNFVYEINNPLGTTYDFTLEYVHWNSLRGEYEYYGMLGDYFDVYVDGSHYKRFRMEGYIEPWYGYLGIDINGSEIEFNDLGKYFNFYTSNECLPIIGKVNEDWPTISLIEGEEYLTFFNVATEDTIGDSFYSGDYLDNGFPIKLIYDKPLYSENNINAILKAEVNGEVAFDTILVKAICITGSSIEASVEYPYVYNNDVNGIYINSTYSDECMLKTLPEDIKFNVAILEGADYGYLINPQTGEKGTVLNNLSHVNGQLYLEFITNQLEPPLEGDIINLLVTTTNPSIPYTEVRMNIFQSKIIIEFDKEKLSPGEEANIYLYMKGPEGEKLAFPNGVDQEFYISIYKNMEYADIYTNEDTISSDMFYPGKQPFKIKAINEIDLDSVRVMLYVDTEIESSDPAITKVNNTDTLQMNNVSMSFNSGLSKKTYNLKSRRIANGKSKTNEKNNINSLGIISSVNTSSELTLIAGVAGIDIKKGGCDDLDICDSPLSVPNFQLKKVIAGGANPDACEPIQRDASGNIKFPIQTGGFAPLYWMKRQNISASPCKNDNGMIQFNMEIKENDKVVNTLKPEYILEFCVNNIAAAGWTLITNTSHMINILNNTLVDGKITANTKAEIKNFEHDIKVSKIYEPKIIKYKLEPVTFAHENRHKEDYDSALVANKERLFDQKIKDYQITCEDYKKPYNEAQEVADINFSRIVREFIEDVIKNSSGKYYNFSSERDYEDFVQRQPKVQMEIANFEKALSNFKRQYGIF